MEGWGNGSILLTALDDFAGQILLCKFSAKLLVETHQLV